MTDGIIQEVFKIYKDRLLSHTLDRKTHRDFDDLQEELIEKIKQEIDAHFVFDCVDICCTLKEHLMGDNQE